MNESDLFRTDLEASSEDVSNPSKLKEILRWGRRVINQIPELREHLSDEVTHLQQFGIPIADLASQLQTLFEQAHKLAEASIQKAQINLQPEGPHFRLRDIQAIHFRLQEWSDASYRYEEFERQADEVSERWAQARDKRVWTPQTLSFDQMFTPWCQWIDHFRNHYHSDLIPCEIGSTWSDDMLPRLLQQDPSRRTVLTSDCLEIHSSHADLFENDLDCYNVDNLLGELGQMVTSDEDPTLVKLVDITPERETYRLMTLRLLGGGAQPIPGRLQTRKLRPIRRDVVVTRHHHQQGVFLSIRQPRIRGGRSSPPRRHPLGAGESILPVQFRQPLRLGSRRRSCCRLESSPMTLSKLPRTLERPMTDIIGAFRRYTLDQNRPLAQAIRDTTSEVESLGGSHHSGRHKQVWTHPESEWVWKVSWYDRIRQESRLMTHHPDLFVPLRCWGTVRVRINQVHARHRRTHGTTLIWQLRARWPDAASRDLEPETVWRVATGVPTCRGTAHLVHRMRRHHEGNSVLHRCHALSKAYDGVSLSEMFALDNLGCHPERPQRIRPLDL